MIRVPKSSTRSVLPSIRQEVAMALGIEQGFGKSGNDHAPSVGKSINLECCAELIIRQQIWVGDHAKSPLLNAFQAYLLVLCDAGGPDWRTIFKHGKYVHLVHCDEVRFRYTISFQLCEDVQSS